MRRLFLTEDWKWRSTIFYLFLICIFMPTASAISCSICGQSNLTAPGECTTQFQYDCLPSPTVGGQQLGQQSTTGGDQRLLQKIMCRTTRTKLAENLFAVIKECVTENDHFNRFPEGKAFGCETVSSNGSFPLTYCVCDQDLCNSPSLDEQLRQPPSDQNQQRPQSQSPARTQPPQQNRTTLRGDQLRQSIPNAPQPVRNAAPGRPQPMLPPQPVDEFSFPTNLQPDPNQSPPNPSFVQEPSTPEQITRKIPVNAQISNSSRVNQPQPRRQPGDAQPKATTLLFARINTEKVEFITDPTPKPNAGSPKAVPNQNAFVCMICNEGNLTSSQDCQVHNPIDCRPLFRPGSNLFCFTKAITLPTGQSQIEKRCASEEQLSQELNLPTVQPTCFSSQDGRARIDYCICNTNKCNQLPISNQANMYPPLTPTDRVNTPNSISQQWSSANVSPTGHQPRMCYVCGESDQVHPSDCSQQYEYDCSRQYPQSATVLCLTRQTKLASGHYNIEKRCITPAEHQLQYPDNEVTLDGCNEAWNGYVQYCVCQGEFCNGQNITIQQEAHHWVQKPNDNPDEESAEDGNKQKQRLTTPPAGARRQPQTSTQSHIPNGLLVPPSTRLPLRPPPVTLGNQTTPKIEKLGGSGHHPDNNFVQEATVLLKTSTESLNPWDNKIRHEGQHQAPTSEGKKRGPNSSRHGDENSHASISSPGFLSFLALIVSTIVVMY